MVWVTYTVNLAVWDSDLSNDDEERFALLESNDDPQLVGVAHVFVAPAFGAARAARHQPVNRQMSVRHAILDRDTVKCFKKSFALRKMEFIVS